MGFCFLIIGCDAYHAWPYKDGYYKDDYSFNNLFTFEFDSFKYYLGFKFHAWMKKNINKKEANHIADGYYLKDINILTTLD